MTVSELMEILSKQPGDKAVMMWNTKWDLPEAIYLLEIDEECVLLG